MLAGMLHREFNKRPPQFLRRSRRREGFTTNEENGQPNRMLRKLASNRQTASLTRGQPARGHARDISWDSFSLAGRTGDGIEDVQTGGQEHLQTQPPLLSLTEGVLRTP